MFRGNHYAQVAAATRRMSNGDDDGVRRDHSNIRTTTAQPIDNTNTLELTRLNQEDSPSLQESQEKNQSFIIRKEAEAELRYIRDPLLLADRVRFALQDGELEKATWLVRAASKRMACTVGWNHLMNYLVGRGRVKEGFGMYNDVWIHLSLIPYEIVAVLLKFLSLLSSL